jgi:D-serine deaminase-like pyridoxal phosphate-dependent protein
MPVPISIHAPNADAGRPARAIEVVRLNDQHAFCRVDPEAPLEVGELVACGVSHPCTAFDKWRVLPVVDDDLRVVDAVATFF